MTAFDAAAVRDAVVGPFGRRLDYRASVDSTNTLALRLAREGAAEGTVVVADEQTAGRGRGSNRWASPPGLGLYFSLLLRPSASVIATPVLGVLGGVAAVHAVRRTAGLDAMLKWPNDVLVDDHKVGGVLADATNLPGGETAAVIGIGLNVDHTPADLPGDTPIPAASLRTAGADRGTREALATHLIAESERLYRGLLDDGPAALEREVVAIWRDRGAWVALDGGDGSAVEGRATAIDLRGGTMRFEDRDGAPFDVSLSRFVRLRRLADD